MHTVQLLLLIYSFCLAPFFRVEFSSLTSQSWARSGRGPFAPWCYAWCSWPRLCSWRRWGRPLQKKKKVSDLALQRQTESAFIPSYWIAQYVVAFYGHTITKFVSAAFLLSLSITPRTTKCRLWYALAGKKRHPLASMELFTHSLDSSDERILPGWDSPAGSHRGSSSPVCPCRASTRYRPGSLGRQGSRPRTISTQCGRQRDHWQPHVRSRSRAGVGGRSSATLWRSGRAPAASRRSAVREWEREYVEKKKTSRQALKRSELKEESPLHSTLLSLSRMHGFPSLNPYSLLLMQSLVIRPAASTWQIWPGPAPFWNEQEDTTFAFELLPDSIRSLYSGRRKQQLLVEQWPKLIISLLYVRSGLRLVGVCTNCTCTEVRVYFLRVPNVLFSQARYVNIVFFADHLHNPFPFVRVRVSAIHTAVFSPGRFTRDGLGVWPDVQGEYAAAARGYAGRSVRHGCASTVAKQRGRCNAENFCTEKASRRTSFKSMFYRCHGTIIKFKKDHFLCCAPVRAYTLLCRGGSYPDSNFEWEWTGRSEVTH